MTVVLVGALGFLIGLAGHDLAIQGLTDDRSLRPLVGTCPQCAHGRGWASFRCQSCGRAVAREPVVALSSGAVAVGFHALWGFGPELIVYLGFLLLSTALLVTDLEEFRIVDRLNLRGTAILGIGMVVVAAIGGDWGSLLRGLLGALAYFAGTTLVWLAAKGRGFGAGDVKLAPQLGLFTAYVSWGTLGWAVFGTAVIGGVLAFVMILMGAARMNTELPYGPPMIIGAWLALVLAGIGSFPVPT